MNGETVEREESITLVANKDDVILIAKFEGISGPFILGKLAQNLKRTSPRVKTHLQVPLSKDKNWTYMYKISEEPLGNIFIPILPVSFEC